MTLPHSFFLFLFYVIAFFGAQVGVGVWFEYDLGPFIATGFIEGKHPSTGRRAERDKAITVRLLCASHVGLSCCHLLRPSRPLTSPQSLRKIHAQGYLHGNLDARNMLVSDGKVRSWLGASAGFFLRSPLTFEEEDVSPCGVTLEDSGGYI